MSLKKKIFKAIRFLSDLSNKLNLFFKGNKGGKEKGSISFKFTWKKFAEEENKCISFFQDFKKDKCF